MERKRHDGMHATDRRQVTDFFLVLGENRCELCRCAGGTVARLADRSTCPTNNSGYAGGTRG